ncbi:MAG: hypothetical protein ACJAR1_002044 [Rubritalea sp.]|jgi:hypothetical protein
MNNKHLFIIPILTLICCSSAIAQDIHPSLKKTASKIDTAGDYISMTKLDGDMAAITQYLEIIFKTAKKNGESIPENLNAKDLLSILGLNSLKAAGSSSKELDNAWINHSYLDNGGSNKGLFSLLGEANQDFVTPTICPAGTDLALQMQMDLRELTPMLMELAKLSGKGEMTANMEKNIPELNMTPSTLLAKLNVTVSLALDINTDENAQTNPLALISGANAIARIDGLNWLWDKIGEQIIAQSGIPFEKSELGGVNTYTFPAEMRKNMLGYSPQLIIDKANGHIWISSKSEFYAKCKSGENSLANSAAFKAAMEHLPSKGNSMMYLSKEMLHTAKSQYDSAAKVGLFGKDFAKGKEILDRLMVDITESNKGWAIVLGKDDDGVILASRGPVGIQHLKYLAPAVPMLLFNSSSAEALDREVGEPRRRKVIE